MMTYLFVLGLVLVDTPTAPETVAQWSFDGTDTAFLETVVTPTGARLHGRPPAYSENVPGAYVYDPLTQQSRANVASAVFTRDADNPDALAINLDFARADLADTSVTIECFVDRKIDDDWSPVAQAAIDSGARVIYFPRTTRFSFRTPIHLRGRVQRLVGFGAELQWSPELWKSEGRYEQTDSENAPPPLLIFDQPDPAHTLVLDRLGCVHLRHASPATLVLRSSTPGRYTTGSAGGRLFAEDVGGADWQFDHPQRVWVRQWNPESHAAGSCIHSLGTTIWALGFKTEYESQKLLAEAGAATEILGAFIYPIGDIPADRPIFENRNSRIALVYGTSVYHSNHQTHIRDIRGSEVKKIGNDTLRRAGSRARMDLYTSDAR